MQTLTVTITGIDEGFVDTLKQGIKLADSILNVNTKDFDNSITIEFNAIRNREIKTKLMKTIFSIYAMQNCVEQIKS